MNYSTEPDTKIGYFLKMNITLVLCATKSNHNFQNMLTFVDLVDEIVLYDTGMIIEEINAIKNVFKQKLVIHIKNTFTM